MGFGSDAMDGTGNIYAAANGLDELLVVPLWIKGNWISK
jgi:hypothetical protein